MSNINKLVLGTVQFGSNYGINNFDGKVSAEEVVSILNLARKEGLTKLDTSSAYGDSEKVLGNCIQSDNNSFQIISKYPKGNSSVSEMINQSLHSLKITHLYGYLLHHFEVYRVNPKIWKDFIMIKEKGLAKKVGFSLYEPNELEFILKNNIEFDILQIPYNILDHKFQPYLKELSDRGIEIHVRSTFLQGLFFMNRDNIPEKIKPLKKYLFLLDEYAKQKRMSISQIALNYNLQNPYIQGVLIGVDNTNQLLTNLNSILDIDLDIEVKEKELLNPVNWR